MLKYLETLSENPSYESLEKLDKEIEAINDSINSMLSISSLSDREAEALKREEGILKIAQELKKEMLNTLAWQTLEYNSKKMLEQNNHSMLDFFFSRIKFISEKLIKN